MIYISKPLLALTISFSMVASPAARAFAPEVLPVPTNLNEAQSRALIEARANGREVEWRLFTATIDGRARSVLLLGEVHVAFPADLNAAKKVIDQFEYMATENGPFSQDPSWHYRMVPLAALMILPENLLLVGLSHREVNSPMRLAMDGARRKYVANAEQLHVPSLGEEADVLAMGGLSLVRVGGLGWLAVSLARLTRGLAPRRLKHVGYAVATVLGGILGESIVFGNLKRVPLVRNRDESMTNYVDQWVRTDASGAPLLVIVGRAHLANMGRFLVERYGFVEVPIDDAHLANPAALLAR